MGLSKTHSHYIKHEDTHTFKAVIKYFLEDSREVDATFKKLSETPKGFKVISNVALAQGIEERCERDKLFKKSFSAHHEMHFDLHNKFKCSSSESTDASWNAFTC